MLGISEEQHGDRTRLFMQWQEMGWPVLIDSLNLLEVTAVPITLLVDKSGVIRYKNPSDHDLESFLAAEYPDTATPEPIARSPELAKALSAVNTGNPAGIAEAISYFRALESKSPRQWFHLGVLHRKRFDSAVGETADFSEAVAAWRKALAGDPGQYIWRRRIQQYGPKLDKPYPFYDWVPEARATITSRNEVPTSLVAEPSGAEYAAPTPSKVATEKPPPHPDPLNKLPDDTRELISVSAVPVPSTDAKKPGWRIHLTFTPNAELDAHWNNESGDMVVWWDSHSGWNPPDSIQGAAVALNAQAANSATSTETRQLEVEIQPNDSNRLPDELRGSAYIYACEGASGTCLFLRKAFAVSLK
ncbi:MAG: hypothetical protein KDN22_29050 [Verrucomicrobiae bacterium]|nr:hypothetical protein [Verrucomicrobiae bacterium]